LLLRASILAEAATVTTVTKGIPHDKSGDYWLDSNARGDKIPAKGHPSLVFFTKNMINYNETNGMK
jgi:hypothetical protein